MSSADLLRTLIGRETDQVEVYLSPPAPGWRNSPSYFVRRLLNRIRTITARQLEPVVWAASPGRRPRYPSLRQALLGGVIRINLPDSAPIRVLQQTSNFKPTGKIHIGSGGGIRQFGYWRDSPVLARLGTVGTSGDPLRHYQALEELSLRKMPPGLATGLVDEVRWTIEGFISGQPLRRVTPQSAKIVSTFLSGLPRGTSPTDVISSSSSRLSAFGIDTSSLVQLIRKDLDHFPTVTAHGDLWSGNVLFRNDSLAAVIDWDSWQERATPGIDLMHLWAEDARRSGGLSYGDLIAGAFWEHDSIGTSMTTYMSQMDIEWNSALLPVMSAAWWLSAVSGAISRNVTLTNDPDWMMGNVLQAVATFHERLN